jgi:hypothetical protein
MIAETERIDRETEINERRHFPVIPPDIETRMLEFVAGKIMPRIHIALAVLVVLGIAQSVIVSGWVTSKSSSQSETIAAQGATLDSTSKQLEALELDVVRKAQLAALTQQVRDLESAARALSATVSEQRRQQEQLNTNVATVSALTLSVQSKVGEEQTARRELVEAMGNLAAEIRERK